MKELKLPNNGSDVPYVRKENESLLQHKEIYFSKRKTKAGILKKSCKKSGRFWNTQ